MGLLQNDEIATLTWIRCSETNCKALRDSARGILRWIDAKHEIPEKSILQHSPDTNRGTTADVKQVQQPKS